jgi:DNA-binding NarL/FixJ family response regulator
MHRDRLDPLASVDATFLDDNGNVTPGTLQVQTRLRTVVVADEWAFVRHGVEAHLRRVGARIIASAPTYHDLGEGLRHADAGPDLAVIGTLPDITTLGAARMFTERGTPVIVLDERPSPRRVLDLWTAGVRAVIGRNARQSELTDALAAIAGGGHYLGAGLLSGVVKAATQSGSGPHANLTGRERDVLRELAAGATNHEISASLHISTQTVKTHLGNIYDKLGVRRRTDAVRMALQHGLL